MKVPVCKYTGIKVYRYGIEIQVQYRSTGTVYMHRYTGAHVFMLILYIKRFWWFICLSPFLGPMHLKKNSIWCSDLPLAWRITTVQYNKYYEVELEVVEHLFPGNRQQYVITYK
jgi:hypothetical protein